MDVFALRRLVIQDYENYVSSFLTLRNQRIRKLVKQEMQEGHLWPEPLVQLSPSFEPGETLEDLIARGALHPWTRRSRSDPSGATLRN